MTDATPSDRQGPATLRRTRPRFAPVPEHLIFSDLSDRAVRLWAMLDRIAGPADVAMPRIAALAQGLRCSRDSVERALRDLREAGWLNVGSGRAAGGVNSYELVDRPPRVHNGCGTPTAPVRHPHLVSERAGEKDPLPPRSGGLRALGTNPRAVAAERQRTGRHTYLCACHGAGVLFDTQPDGSLVPRPCDAGTVGPGPVSVPNVG